MPRRPTQRVGRPGREQLGVGDQCEIGLEVGGFGSNEGGNSLSSHFFFAFKQYAHVERERMFGGQQRLQSLDLRPHLPFVIHSAARVEVAVAFCRLEGRREPFIERIGRLHIVVAVDKHCGFACRVQPVRVDERMAFGLDEARILHADAASARRAATRRPCGNRLDAREELRSKEYAAGPSAHQENAVDFRGHKWRRMKT